MNEQVSSAAALPRGGRGQTLVAVGACWICLLWLFRADLAAMVGQWRGSTTFTYGFLVAPGVAFLAWQRRAALYRVAARPDWLPAAAMLLAGSLWMLGELGSLQAARQIALVAMLVTSLWLIAGREIARVLAWPLAFMFFLVPEGEFLIPLLMDWTADFTAAAARATGIPVFREGMQLTIPAGSFQIIEACSGVRFLLASVALGFFMAGAVFHSWRRRAILLLASVGVALLVNGLRAYGILLLGQLSDMRLVADHVLIGQLFFSATCFLVCWLAIRYSDLESLTVMPVTVPAADESGISRPGTQSLAALVAVMLSISPLLLAPVLQARLAARPPGPAAELPAAVAGRPGLIPTDKVWRPQFSSASTELARRYGDVYAYVFTYLQESEGAELVSARNRLFDREQWQRVRTRRGLRHSSGPAYNQLEIRGFAGSLLLRYWYLLDGDALPRPGAAKLLALRQLFSANQPSASLVAIGVPIDSDSAAAERQLDEFLDAFCAADVSAGALQPCGR